MKSTVKYVLLCLVMLAGLAGCDSGRIFDSYREIPEAIWHKDSIIIFHVPVTDTLQEHNLYIQLRNETSYRYSNIWLFIEINQPGRETTKDTFEVVLADPKGKWLGEGFGGLKTVQTIFRRDVVFPASGEFRVAIQHGMRDENLHGIHDIGFRLEQTNHK